MSLYDQSIPQCLKMLANLDAWLQQAIDSAGERSFDPEVLLHARLAPDMFSLTRQVQSSCDAAKFIGARLANAEPPSHPDTETTLAELRERIAKTRAWLEGLDAAAFEGAAERQLSLPFLPEGTVVSGRDYLHEFGLPNFYFHLGMAYALLRKNGVTLGKRAWLGSMNVQPAER